MKNIHFFLLIFTVLMVSSCRDDVTTTDETMTTPEPVVKIFAAFNGFVFNIDGDAIEGARIQMAGNEAYTDTEGYFKINGQVNNNGAYIKASFDGYFDAFGNVIPSEDGVGHVQFTLKERNPIGTINSATANTLTTENGSEISFEANAFKNGDGSDFGGEVTVYADYIDPTAENFNTVMPGDLAAMTLEESSVILQSFGMLNIELEDASGDEVELAKPATLKFHVPESLQGQAASEIPLWYFDEVSGLWIEEGVAVLKNGMYEGQVEHFTLWNCDVPMDYVVLSGNVYARGPLPNVVIKVTWIENGQMATTTADDEGNFDGKVPANAVLLVEIFDECGDLIWSDEIGPLTEDYFLQIALDPTEIESVLVSGTLSCDGEAVTDGYALVQTDSGAHYSTEVDENGDFSIEFLICDATTLSVTGINSETSEQGAAQEFDIASEVLTGSIESCGTDIVYEAIFDFDNWDDLVMPNVTATDMGSSDSLLVHEISFNDNQSMGNVNYLFTILNWTQDIDDPLWAYAYQIIESGTLEHVYVPDGGTSGSGQNSNEMEVLVTGDYIEVFIPDVEFEDIVSGGTDTGTIWFRGKLE